MFPRFDPSGDVRVLTKGMSASPGAAVGQDRVHSGAAGVGRPRRATSSSCARETNPDDLVGMIASEGILTSRGGKTSHAAVVARGMGTTCVCGAEELIDSGAEVHHPGRPGMVLKEGDLVSIDGGTGEVFLGEVPVMPSARRRLLRGQARPGRRGDRRPSRRCTGSWRSPTPTAPAVRANADTPRTPRARCRFGAEGIGLCRTEHMFLGDRRELVERLILAETDETARPPWRRCARCSGDFEDLRGDGRLPVTVRLLDPPLHEFLPSLTEMSVKVAIAEDRQPVTRPTRRCSPPCERLHESNPMLGLRGVRLGIVIQGPVRDAGPGHPRGLPSGPPERGGGRDGRDHGAAHRHLPGARVRPQEAEDRSRRRPGRARVRRSPRSAR
jgi:pyruvate,orthophosphate dikinase